MLLLVDPNSQSVNGKGEAGRDDWRGASFVNDPVVLVLLVPALLLVEILDNPDSDM